jgi:hypothetical protein
MRHARPVLIWGVLLVIASINGIAREAVLISRIGDLAGRAVSTLALSVFIIILTWISISWIAPRSTRQAWAVGVIWVALTLAFEFLAGHFVFHNSWSRLLEDYDVLGGRIWILALVTTLVSPRTCVGLRDPSATD